MSVPVNNNKQIKLIADLGRLWGSKQEQLAIEKTIQALDARYDLKRKMAKEPGVEDIIKQMAGRLANSYPILADVQNKRILDIACGSNTSKLPASFFLSTLFGGRSIIPNQGYTALFEPWFCRILFELGATPVGVDFGDLEQEVFTHYRVDLGKRGALDFLPNHSFDGIQDSRLFGSPEFTAQFRNPAERLLVAREIVRQEQRLLKVDGILIHSDATELVK
jgi:hypothetical protein